MANDVLPGIWPQELKQIVEAIEKKYYFVKEIDKGKTGAAYEIKESKTKKSFCLKTVSPESKVPLEEVRDTLKKEVEILLPLSHRCLPTIYDNELTNSLPYYICTFHPGTTFYKFKNQNKTLGREESIFAILQLIDAFEYLHETGRTHCDFHFNNVLISENVFRDGILVIDFGSGHRDSDTTPATRNRGNFQMKDVDGQNNYREMVDRHEAKGSFEQADFHAFGQLLAFMMECFFHDAPMDQRIIYKSFCADLSAGKITEWSKARDRFFTVMDPRRLLTACDKMFIGKDGKRESITIPITRYVQVGSPTLSVINATTFQRLRRIKQLSFCEWFFPGGTHTRFEHSLGVMELTRKAVTLLVSDPIFRDLYSPRNIQGLILAALLHDVGHYPFAHILEHYVSSRFPGDSEAKTIASHSAHTLHILQSDVELKEALDQNFDADIVQEIEKILTGKLPLLSELLDGAVDCDKLDYLQRDGHHCGVAFGGGIDADGVLRSFCCLNDGKNLGIRRTGVAAVEGFVIAQDQMLAAVYWQEHVRSVIAMFHSFLAAIIRTDKAKLREVAEQLQKCNDERQAIDHVLAPKLKGLPILIQRQVTPLIDLHRDPNFKQIFIPICKFTNHDHLPPNSRRMDTIFRLIMRRASESVSSVPIDWNTVKELRKCFIKAFREKKIDAASFEVLIDVPWGKAGSRRVQVKGEEDATGVLDITQVSHLNPSIFENPAAYLAPVRVYISPELFQKSETIIDTVVHNAKDMFNSNERIEIDLDD